MQNKTKKVKCMLLPKIFLGAIQLRKNSIFISHKATLKPSFKNVTTVPNHLNLHAKFFDNMFTIKKTVSPAFTSPISKLCNSAVLYVPEIIKVWIQVCGKVNE